MLDFALNTRNVHKELKEGTHELVMVFNGYSAKRKEKMKTSASKEQEGKKECAKITSSQLKMEEPVKAKPTKNESTSILCWWDMRTIIEPTAQQNDPEEGTWSEVVGRKQRKKALNKSQPQKETEQEININNRRTNVKQKRQRIKSCAMIIDQGTEAFPEIVKRIRMGIDKQIIGDRISSIRQAKNGGTIILVRGGQAAQVVRNELLKMTKEAYIKPYSRSALLKSKIWI